MPTLHIEHAITDLPTWKAAFETFAEVRRQAGVTRETVRRPVGSERFVVIDLEFGTVDQATTFLHFLETTVWADRDHSPALAGAPETKILETVMRSS